MPTLLEVQAAMHCSLVAGDDAAMTAFLADPAAADRLNIYRNTFILSLTKALNLCYPVVKRLVGEDFFEGAAQHFVTRHPPQTAYLNQYGGDFPEFLRHECILLRSGRIHESERTGGRVHFIRRFDVVLYQNRDAVEHRATVAFFALLVHLVGNRQGIRV